MASENTNRNLPKEIGNKSNTADVLIIGGSAAGISAAMTAGKHYPDVTVALARQEGQVPIACGIPYVFGTLGSPDKNLIPDAAVTSNDVELAWTGSQPYIETRTPSPP